MKVPLMLVRWGAHVMNIGSYLHISLPGFLVARAVRFLWNHPETLVPFLTTIRPEELERLADRLVVYRVKLTYPKTPALVEYLKYFSIDSIKNLQDFRHIPSTNKTNYVKKYPLEYRCLNGALPKNGSLYESAGTSGKSTLWAESKEEEVFLEKYVQFAMDYNYGIGERKFIVLNCWAFGMWPTAIDFTKAVTKLALVVNIGTKIQEALETLKTMGDSYNYIIVGYPPFISHLLEEGVRAGFVWGDWNISVLSGGEGFIEEWRADIHRYLGEEALVYSAYGSTDLGLSEGMEGMVAVTIRKILHIYQTFLDDREMALSMARRYFPQVETEKFFTINIDTIRSLFLSLFRTDPTIDRRLPMIFQYDPTTFYNEEVVSTGENGYDSVEMVTTVIRDHTAIPRVRYNVKDERGIISYRDMFEKFRMVGIDIHIILELSGHDPKNILHLPFFYIFGRTDGTISIDGANIFPADIEEMFADHEEFSGISSFIMHITEDHRLGLDIELKQGVTYTDAEKDGLRPVFRKYLLQYSGGYQDIVHEELPSSELVIEFYLFGTGAFSESPLASTRLVKYKYIRK